MGLISVGKAYTIIREKYILNGNGGRPPKDFRTEYRELLDKYNPTIEELVEELLDAVHYAIKAKKIIEKVKEKEKLLSAQAPPKQIKKEFLSVDFR